MERTFMHVGGSIARGIALIALVAMAFSCSARTAPVQAPVKPATTVKAPSPVTFIENNFEEATKRARSEHKLLFVDASAPWCHSCKSMRAFVLNDPKLGALDESYVWLEVDTESDANRDFVARFSNKSWPTLRVVDPTTHALILEWEGTATADELVLLLDDVRNTAARPTLLFLKAFLEATERHGERKFEEAAAGFERVLRDAPVSWPHRARAMEGWILNASDRKDFIACAERASDFLDKVSPSSTSHASILATSLACSAEAKGHNAGDLTTRAERALKSKLPILADDRSSLFESLAHHFKDRELDSDAKRVGLAWLAFVTDEAARAPSPTARSVFDAHLVEAAIFSGVPERAIAALEASERDFPKDYNPPARLARVYLEMKRLDDARFAVARATGRVYGPRALRVFLLAADIAKARGDREEEREALDEALKRTEKLTLTASQVKARNAAQERKNTLPARK